MLKEKYSTTIPFSGFYESVHTSLIDDAEISYFDTEGTGDRDVIPEHMYLCDWSKAWPEYAELYTSAFQDFFNEATGLNITFTFEKLDSPKEYNFTTDRIFCDISGADLMKIYSYFSNEKSITVLEKAIQERFTTHDGFISSYSNKLGDWLVKGSTNFDHNEIGTLVEAALKVCNAELDDYELMENAICNGRIQSIADDVISNFLKTNPIPKTA